MLFMFVVPLRASVLTRFRPYVLRRAFCSSRSCLQDEVVSLRVGGNGTIDLQISKPKLVSNHNNIIVYLPPGPVPDGISREWTFLNPLHLSKYFPDATIVDVRYRLLPRETKSDLDCRFPTPIHDVFRACDYIVEEARLRNLSMDMTSKSSKQPKICLFGSHIGGALAMTLALTNPAQIHAVAVEEPLVDWPGLDELTEDRVAMKKTAKRGQDDHEAAVVAAKALMGLRTTLFRTPSGYFDAFASPTQFLRAPGRDTPLTKTAALIDSAEDVIEGTPIRYGEEDDEIGLVEDESRAFGPYDDEWHAIETTRLRNKEYRVDVEDHKPIGNSMDEQITTIADESGDSIPAIKPSTPAASRRRKVLRRWPPTLQPEGVVLPYVNINLRQPNVKGVVDMDNSGTTDIAPVLHLQGLEFLGLLRRACFWGREKGFAEERVVLTEFNNSATLEQRQEKVSEWLRERFND